MPIARLHVEWQNDEPAVDSANGMSGTDTVGVKLLANAKVESMCSDHQDHLSLVATCLKDAGKFYVRRPTSSSRRPGFVDHAKTVALVTITGLALIWLMMWLKAVLVPLVLAAFFLCQLEPVFFCILNPASIFKRCSRRLQSRALLIDRERIELFGNDVSNCSSTVSSTSWLGVGRGLAWKLQIFVALFSCLLILLLTFVGCIYAIYKSIEDFSWKKYADSPRTLKILRKVQSITKTSEELEEVTEDMDYSALLKWFMDGTFIETFIGIILSFIGTVFLMGLFLAFLLVSNVAKDTHARTELTHKASVSVRRYVQIKTQVSLIVALLVWGVYDLLDVDLGFLFAFLTFILNYIPHIGYTIAILLPLPLVFLDPTKTWGDFLNCLLLPLFIHTVFFYFIEPKLLSRSLEIHPVVVLVSLAFWTVCWGAVGAILAVPLTSVGRLILLEINHPYAAVLAGLLEGQWHQKHAAQWMSPFEGQLDTFEAWMKSSLPRGLSDLWSRPRRRSGSFGRTRATDGTSDSSVTRASPESSHRHSDPSERDACSFLNSPTPESASQGVRLRNLKSYTSETHLDAKCIVAL